jgi:intracellular septation protein
MTLSPRAKKWVSSFVDYGWPLAFLITLLVTHDMMKATWGLVAGAAVALAVGFIVERRIAPLPLVAGLMSLILGGMALYFHDSRFIKIRPTISGVAFGVFLIGGVMMGKNPMKALLSVAFQMSDEGWRKLAWRYGLFFLATAVANEFVWRTQSDVTWALFKFPGLSVIHVLFGLSQVPLMMKYAHVEEPPPVPPVE